MGGRTKDKREYIGVKEFAKEVGYSERHVRRLIKLGEIHASRSENRRKWLIHVSEKVKFRGGKARIPTEKVEIKGVEKDFGGIDTEARKKHFMQMVKIAKALLSQWLDSVKCVGEGTYEFVNYEYYPPLTHVERINRRELVRILKGNLEYTSRLFQTMDMFDCFKLHLEAENPQIKDIAQYIETSPMEFINTLKTVCLRGKMKGKCLVCRE